MKNIIKAIFLSASLILFFSINAYAQKYLEYLNDASITNYYELEKKVEAYYADKDKGRGSGYKQWKRWSIKNGPNFYPSGEMYNTVAHNRKELDSYRQTAKPANKSTNGYWIDRGPTDYNLGDGYNGGVGRVNVMVENPNNSSILFVGTPAGGLWKSTNSGSTWTNLTDGMPTLGVSGIAINPNNTNIIYILTGDGDGGDTDGIGVLKSTDGGVSWNPTGTQISGRGYRLIMHPTNANILFAATTSGLYKTSNGGTSWVLERSGSVTDVEFKPGSPATMYCVRTNGFYRSTDTGANWSLVTSAAFPSSYTRISLSVCPSNTSRVYLLFGGGTNDFAALCRSTNSGITWSLRSNNSSGNNNILGYDCDGTDDKNQAGYDLALIVDPTNSNIVYAAGIIVFKSTDGGLNWTCMTEWFEPSSVGYAHADVHYLEFYSNRLYVCSDGGIYRSTNGASTFTDLSSGLSNMQFYYLDVEGTTYAGGTQDNGCNQGTIFNPVTTHSTGADGFACLINYNNTNIRYQSTQGSKRRSTNGGSSFTTITPTGTDNYWEADWIMDTGNPERLFLGHNGEIYRTNNASTVTTTTWQDLNAGFSGSNTIRAIAQGTSNPNRLYASNYTTLRRSDNALATTPTFTNKTTGLPVGSALISDISADPDNSLRVYVSFLGTSAANKVFRSTNGGDNWTNITGSLPNVPVNAIIAEAGTENGVYVGTDIGVFYRNDNIGNWIFFSNGMPTVRVFDLDIEGSSIYAGTHGRGIWSSAVYSTCSSALTLTPGNDPSNSNYTGNQVYNSLNSITSTREITGGIGTDVQYNTEGFIDLKTGFWAKQNNLFVAKLDDCPE